MVCTPGFVWGKWGRQAYKQQATVEGATFQERNKLRVICAKCGVIVAQSSLKQYMTIQRGICIPQTRRVDEKGGRPTTYVVSFPRVLNSVRFPKPGCPAVAHSAARLQEIFMFRHFWSRIAVVQEGKEPLPRCNLCGVHMPALRLIKHLQTTQYYQNMQMRWQRWDVEIAANYAGANFSLTG